VAATKQVVYVLDYAEGATYEQRDPVLWRWSGERKNFTVMNQLLNRRILSGYPKSPDQFEVGDCPWRSFPAKLRAREGAAMDTRRQWSQLARWTFWSAVLAAFLNCQTITLAQDQQEYLALRDLKIDLEKAIKDATLVSNEPPFFIIEKIELKLQGETRTGADGSASFSIPIFKAGIDVGAKGVETQSETLTLDLVPPDKTIAGGVRRVDFTPLMRTLKDTFKSDTGLQARSVTYTKSWALQLDADAKINVVVAKAGVTIAKDKTQDVTFYLCQTLNRLDCIK
jgi:hypothetical protein